MLKIKIVTVLGCIALLLIGCGDDEKKADASTDGSLPSLDGTAQSGGTGGVPTGGSGGTITGGTGGSNTGLDSGTTGGTGGTIGEDDDAGVDEDASADASESQDAAGQDGAGQDAGGGEDELPDPGEPLSVCTRDSECQTISDDLVCHQDEAGNPGFCTDDCLQDSNCQTIDGFEYVCLDDECVVECEGEDSTDCPQGMECRDENEGPGDSRFVCHYTDDVLTDTRGFLESCDANLNDRDCEGDLVCYAGFGGTGTGYCTNTCEDSGDCEQPDDVEADFTCSTNSDVCRFEQCDNDDDCPTDMECTGEGAMSRCAYPRN